MSNISEFKLNRVNSRIAKDIIIAGLNTDHVVMLSGSPGIGKSDIIRQVAKELNLEVIDHRLSTSAIEDLTGLPQFSKKIDANGREQDIAKFTPLNIFPMEWWPLPKGKDGWLLFFDEMNSADESIIAACYKIVLDRMVGLHKLHPCCGIVCAGNRAEDNAIVNSMGTAMTSRLSHIELIVDPDIWYQDVAIKQDYDYRVKAFIQANPSCLNEFNPEKDNETFSCPRTWSYINDYIKSLYTYNEDGTIKDKCDTLPEWFLPLASGTITPNTASFFVAFCNNINKIIPYTAILKDPDNCRLPENPEITFATILSLVDHTDKDNFATFFKYVSRMDRSHQLFYFQSAALANKKLLASPVYRQLTLQFRNDLVNLGVIM